MELEWKYIENQFLIGTDDSFKKALRLSQYHDGVLRTRATLAVPDPDDVLMYNRYHPEHLLYVSRYTTWKNAGGQQEGQTLNVQQLLSLTTGKLDLWDQAIIPITGGTKTVAYKALFPNGRRPFNTGTIDTRIEAFNTLQLALTDPALAATKALVLAHYNALDTARDAQSGAKSTTGTGSQLVDAQRVVVMNLQYADLGLLMNKHFANTQLIKPYFDLVILRDQSQALFTGTLDPSEVEPVLVHTFITGDELRCKNTGAQPYKLYLSNVAGGTTGTAVDIAAGADEIINISAFAAPNLATHRYLTARNITVAVTTYSIEIL